MGRQEGFAREYCALLSVIFLAVPARLFGSDLITSDISGSGTFTWNLPGSIIIDPGKGGNFSGNIFGLATVVKRGDGLAIFSGGFSSNYTGGTFVEGGTFLVNSPAGRPTALGPVQVSPGATLGGSGGTRGLLTIQAEGILSPDNGPGSITLHGGLHLQAGSILKMDLNSATPDRVIVDGGLFSSEGAMVNVVAADLPLTPGRVFTIADWTGAIGYNISPEQFTLQSSIITGFFRVPEGTSRLELVVPEPSMLPLLAVALGVVARRKRITK